MACPRETVEQQQPWMSMAPEELEAQYSPSQWSKRHDAKGVIEEHLKVATERSKAARCSVTHQRLDVTYSSLGPRAKLDVYGEDLPPESAVLVYVHGGYWQEPLSKDVSAYVVEPLYRARVVSVVVNYDLAPQASVEKIVSEARAAVVWACELARGRGSRGVILAGWSAGAQLVTQALTTVTPGSSGATDLTPYKDLIRGVVTLSGVFDLRPLVSTYVNQPLHLTELRAWALSPLAAVGVLGRAWPGVRLLVTVGQHDSPEFRRQSRQYCEACVEAGLKAECVEVEGMDHFNMVEDLAKGQMAHTKRVLAFVHACTAPRPHTGNHTNTGQE